MGSQMSCPSALLTSFPHMLKRTRGEISRVVCLHKSVNQSNLIFLIKHSLLVHLSGGEGKELKTQTNSSLYHIQCVLAVRGLCPTVQGLHNHSDTQVPAIEKPHQSLGHWNPTLKPLHLISRGWKRESMEDFQRDFMGSAWKWSVLLLPIVHWPELVTNLHLPAREFGKCGLTMPEGKGNGVWGTCIALSLPQIHRKVWIETLI